MSETAIRAAKAAGAIPVLIWPPSDAEKRRMLTDEIAWLERFMTAAERDLEWARQEMAAARASLELVRG